MSSSCVVGAFTSSAQFFRSYLVAFIAFSTLSLGCLGLLMVQHLSGGAWGLVIRRILEAGGQNVAGDGACSSCR